jgi:eukaryotic-like serine/threonine-protein kinase
VVPALKSAGEPWEVLVVRPGRNPMTALATALEHLRDTRDSEPVFVDADKLRAEPGTFGARLRARARRRRTQILVFVDQHEELYTLVPDPAERLGFTACLAGAGDDPAGPLRVIVSMRSDFLDRAAEDRRFVEELTRGLVFVQPPSRAGLEEALTQPLEMVGFGFESGVTHAMLEALETTSGALPLLQFTAAKLWETRDRQRRVLTRDSYLAMGGVAGALATHADEVLAGLPATDQRLVRAIFQRLVTPERTRAIVDTRELRDIGPEVNRLVANLVEARLLVVQMRGESEGSVELVHESLIKSWPTLQRWLDENQEDAAYVAQVRAAAKQWDAKGRPEGLLWRGEAMEEARVWRRRYLGELPPRERDFLDAIAELASRDARRRRRAVAGGFAALLALLAAAGVALVQISAAKQEAETERAAASKAAVQAQQAEASARQARDDAELEAERARTAEQLALDEKEKADERLRLLTEKDKTLAAKNKALEVTQAKASASAKLAAQKAEEARRARELEREAERKRREEAQKAKITTGLK